MDGLDDFVVAGAAAEVVGEEKADAFFGRVGFFFEQSFGGNDEAWCADAALQGGVFEKGFLDGVEFVAAGDAFDGGDLAALGFDAEDEAGGDEAAIESDGAGAAVAIVAALFGAGHVQGVAEDFKKALARFAEEVSFFAVDGGVDVRFGLHG